MARFQTAETDTVAIEAGADLRTNLNCLVKVDSNGEIVLCGSGEKALGSIYETNLNSSDDYGPVTVQYRGIAKVKAGGAITKGARVQSGASGKATTGATNPIGVALESASGDGSIIAVALIQ